MSLHSSSQPKHLPNSFQRSNFEPQNQELLLDSTPQQNNQIQNHTKNTTHNLTSQPNTSSYQPNQTQSLTINQNADLYLQKQHCKLNADLDDYHDLETEIQKLKIIKNQYKQQKHSIQKLTKAVETLKTQNKSLKLSKQSNRQNSPKLNLLNQVPENYQTNQKKPGKRILNQNIIKDNLFSRNLNSKNINLSHEGLYLSPQSHRRISSNSLRNIHTPNLNNEENYLKDMIRIDEQIMIKNHQNNKKSVIANFVEELKYQLEQNEAILNKQKRAHRDTKQKLQTCLEELAHLRTLIDRQNCNNLLEKENIQLRNQLEIETERRLLAQQRLKQQQLMFSHYESGFSTRGSQFDRELDKMDQIYFSIERTLKL